MAVIVATTAAVAVAPAAAVDRISRQPGFNARAWTLTAPDANGVRYIGGDFTSYRAWNTGKVAAISTTTGQVDPRFPSVSTWPSIYAVASDGSGGFFVAGGTLTVDGAARSRMVHILADGSTDAAFTPTFDNTVLAIDYDAATGTVFAGGSFGNVNGQPRSKVAAISASGTLLSFNPGANQAVWAIRKVGTNVYIAGQFGTLAGVTRGRAGSVRLDARTPAATGTCLDNWDNADCLNAFDPQSTGWGIQGIAVDGGTAYLTGNLGNVGGQARTGLAAVDAATGALDAWNPGLDADARAVAVAGGAVYVGGSFGQAGGAARGMGAAFSTSAGHALQAWNPAAVDGGVTQDGSGIRDIEIVGSTVYLAGNFWSLGGTARNRLGAVDATTGAPTSWNPHVGDATNGVSSTVESIAVHGTTAVIGGTFPTVGGLPRWHAAAIGADGILTGWAPAVSGPVYSFASTGSTIYMVGTFQSVNGQSRVWAAAVGTNGELTSWNPQPTGDRPVKVIHGNGKVYIAGFFNQVGGTARTGLAATDPTTGALAAGFDANVDGAVEDLVLDGGTLYVAGRYSTAGGVARDRLAAVNATTGALVAAFDIGTWGAVHGRGIYTRALAIQGNRLFVGGSFTSVTPVGGSSTTRNYVAAFDTATGALDPAWNAGLRVGSNGNGDVLAIAPTTDAIYLGGEQMGYSTGGVTRDGLAAVNPATGALLAWQADVNAPEVRGLSASDAAVYIAGNFGSVGGQTRENTAAVGTNGTVLTAWPMDPGDNHALTVQITGTHPGRITSDPGGINCGGACTYGFASGQSVTLHASDPAGSDFGGWTGACSGTSPTCTVTVSQVRSVTATYVALGSAPSPGAAPSPDPVSDRDPSAAIPQSGTARPPVAAPVGRVVVRPAPGGARTTVAQSVGLPLAGRYTFIYVDARGKRVPMARGTRIGSRNLVRRSSASVLRLTAPGAVKITALLRRRNGAGITLRVIRRNPDGTVERVDLPVGS